MAPLGLVLGLVAIAMTGIIWVGLVQLRLTTQTGAVERHRRDVQAQIQVLNARLQNENAAIRQWARDNGMVDGAPGSRVWLP